RQGSRFRSATFMRRARQRLAKLAATDRELGKSATAVIVALARSLPPVGRPRLVHGSLYTRHVLDLGEAAGLIDCDHFGQGRAGRIPAVDPGREACEDPEGSRACDERLRSCWRVGGCR